MKLTKGFRDILIDKVVTATFKDKDKDIETEENNIATEIYNLIYSEEIRRNMAFFPIGFFYTSKTMYIELVVGERPVGVQLPIPLPVSASDANDWRRPLLTKSDNTKELIDRVGKLIEKQNARNKSKVQFREKLASFIYGMSTLKRLDEEWPDWRLYHDVPEVRRVNLPVIRGEEITRLIETIRG